MTDGIASDTGTFNINITNNAPVASDDSDSVVHDNTLIDVVYATDLDANILRYSLATAPAHGTVSLADNGSFTYIPAAGYVGTDSFTFRASDGLQSDTGTFTINVTNNSPSADDDTEVTWVDETLHSSVTASDLDADLLMYSVASGPSHGTLILDPVGGYSYTPASGFDGTDSFSFSVSDGIASDTGTVTIEVVIPTGGSSTLPSVSISAGGIIEEENETTATFTLSRTGSTAAALTVGLQHFGTGPTYDHRAQANDYTLWVNGVASGLSVVIPVDQPSVTVTVKAVDDTTVEENEQFQLWIAPSTNYQRGPTGVSAAFTIKDDEWRWVTPSGPDADGWWWWEDANGHDVEEVVDRTLLPDGTVSAGGYIQSDPNAVTADMHGQLVFPGFPNDWVYWVENDLVLAFDGDAQTGQIWRDGTVTDLPGAPDADGGFLSGALGYNWAIHDDTGTDIHTVDVEINLEVTAGGTYSWTGNVTGSGGKYGSAGFALSTSESWKETIPAGKVVTLFYRKGPSP